MKCSFLSAPPDLVGLLAVRPCFLSISYHCTW